MGGTLVLLRRMGVSIVHTQQQHRAFAQAHEALRNAAHDGAAHAASAVGAHHDQFGAKQPSGVFRNQQNFGALFSSQRLAPFMN